MRKVILFLLSAWSTYAMAQNTFPSTGNVGIGTTNPRAVIDVGSSISNGQLGSVLGRLVEGDGVGEGTFIGTRGFSTSIIGGKSFALEHGFYSQVNSSIGFHRGGSILGGFLTFSTNDNTEKMRITESGNVGIGTTTPKEKLSVNGNIRAKEVKIETANWPDYVFEQNYKLISLIDLECYIKTNKHLPGIPDAQTLEKDGIAISETIKAQQKIIEELTLHLIEKDKEMKKYELDKSLEKNKNNVLSAKLEELLKRVETLEKTDDK